MGDILFAILKRDKNQQKYASQKDHMKDILQCAPFIGNGKCKWYSVVSDAFLVVLAHNYLQRKENNAIQSIFYGKIDYDHDKKQTNILIKKLQNTVKL